MKLKKKKKKNTTAHISYKNKTKIATPAPPKRFQPKGYYFKKIFYTKNVNILLLAPGKKEHNFTLAT